MSIPARIDDTFISGDTHIIECYHVDGSGNVIDISGWNARCQLRSNVNSDDIILEVEYTIGIVDGALGLAKITLPATETEILVQDDKDKIIYVYDVEISNPVDGFVKTLIGGQLTSQKGVTR